MSRFDDWVTDPRITRTGTDAFLADKQSVRRLCQQRFAVWSASSTTDEPGIFAHHSFALRVYTGLASLRLWPVVLCAEQLRQVGQRGFPQEMLYSLTWDAPLGRACAESCS